MTSSRSLNKEGFTLIELLIIIGIIGFLAAAILVAVDPVKRLGEAKDAKRWAEVNALLNAVLQKQVDGKDYFAGSVNYPVVPDNALAQMIYIDEADAATKPDCTIAPPACTNQALNVVNPADCWVNMEDLVPEYIADIPVDPTGGTSAVSNYYFRKSATGGRIEIGACVTDEATAISVKR